MRKPWKNCRGNTNFNHLRVTSDVTGQVKVKMFDISGLVTSASKISMLTRAPLGYFYNAPHWGAISSPPPSDLQNYWADSKNSRGI